LDLDESIGREGILGNGFAIVGEGGEVELYGFMGHLDGMLVVTAPGDATLEGGYGHGISPFRLGGEVDAVGKSLHCLLILRRPDEGSRRARGIRQSTLGRFSSILYLLRLDRRAT
jgi:hypothetical protein